MPPSGRFGWQTAHPYAQSQVYTRVRMRCAPYHDTVVWMSMWAVPSVCLLAIRCDQRASLPAWWSGQGCFDHDIIVYPLPSVCRLPTTHTHRHTPQRSSLFSFLLPFFFLSHTLLCCSLRSPGTDFPGINSERRPAKVASPPLFSSRHSARYGTSHSKLQRLQLRADNRQRGSASVLHET